MIGRTFSARTLRIWCVSRMPSIPGICRSRIARSKCSPFSIQDSASCGNSVSLGVMPHFPVWSDRMRRLVALSSTIRTHLPCRLAWMPNRSREVLRSGTSAGSARMVKRKLEPLPIPALWARIVPPIISARRRLMARPSPVPPNLRVVEESACEKDWNRRFMFPSEMPMPVSRTVKTSSFSALPLFTVSTTSP